MIKSIFALVLFNAWILSSYNQKQIKLGTYGSYASYNFYTQLQLLDSNKFVFTHLTKNGPSVRRLTGTWIVKDNYLSLEGDFNRKFVVEKYLIKGDSILCPVKTVNHITCLKYTP
jgi:hypothetical protein